MRKNELKAKLKSAWALQKQIENDYEELQRLRDCANKITPAYSLVPGSGGDNQKVATAVAKIVDLEKAINADMARLMTALQEVRELISLLNDDTQIVVMRMRYLNYKKWEVIAADLGYSWRQVHRLHGRALNSILNKCK